MRFTSCVVGVIASAASVVAVPTGSSPRADSAPPLATGSIEGIVTRVERPARRVVNRYGGGGNAAARVLQELPTVVYLEGRIEGAAAVTRQASQLELAQQDTSFAPAMLLVPLGASVAFPNRDPFFHNVFSFSPAKRLDLGRYAKGESKTVQFDRAGAVKVYCEVHQFMRAAVIVVENPYHAVVGEDGRFALRDVPAGRHRLVVWHIDQRPHEADVTIIAGAVTQVQVALQ